ncbi:MAG: PorV/PorQ family protein [Elusimicrobiota bacterium]|jgi:tetratricopeptide (TPR) repeat protein
MPIIPTTLAVLLLACSPAAAGGPTGGSEVFNFLFLDANARAVALGGAYTSLASDSNALLYNPAGLGFIERDEATFMHHQYLDEGLSQEYFGGALRQGFGLSVNYLGFGKVSRTTYAVPEGTGLGDFDLTDLAVSVGYGRRIFRDLSAGLAYKYLREAADRFAANGHAVDLGLLYAPAAWEGLRLAASLQNIGPSVRWQGADQPLPLNGRWGASYSFPWRGLEHTLSVDGLKSRGDRVRAAAGVETVVARTLALRLGFSGRVDAGPGVTAGLGVRYASLMADYAFVPYGSLGNSHRASVTWRWGPAVERPKAPPAAAQEPEPEQREPGPEERLERAEKLLEDGLFDEARLELYAAAKLLDEGDRRRVRVHERLGRASYLERDFRKAKASFTEAIRLASELGVKGAGVGDAYAGMGLCLAEEGSDAYAKKFLLKALEAGPSAPARKEVKEELRRLEERE